MKPTRLKQVCQTHLEHKVKVKATTQVVMNPIFFETFDP